jgi:hypothetical protein
LNVSNQSAARKSDQWHDRIQYPSTRGDFFYVRVPTI